MVGQMVDLETGDFVFGFIGSRDNAISSVTSGFKGARVNHIGLVLRNARGTYVLEAFPPEVRLTAFDVFVRRTSDEEGMPRLLRARLGMAVPEGEPGSNPGDISNDRRLDMIEVVGTIPGHVP